MKYFNKIILLFSILVISVNSSSFSMTDDKNKSSEKTCQSDKDVQDAELEKKCAYLKTLIEELITATNQNNVDVVQRCIFTLETMGISAKKSANLRIKDKGSGYYGRTLLHIATEQGNEGVICNLICAGANLNAKVKNPECYHHDWTALHIAAWMYKTFNSQKHASITRILRENGADIYAKIDNPFSEFREWTAFAILCN